jgi:succinyl-CoA synthetase beta subunit
LKLLEYQGTQLFSRVGLPVPPGELADTPEEAGQAAHKLGPPVVVKAQVAAGGRGKAGGIKFAQTPEEARGHAASILNMAIQGEPVRRLLVTQAVEIEQEYYLGITLDLAGGWAFCVLGRMGG